MSFSKGDLFHIIMRNGIYQVLGLFSLDDKGNTYYFRKVFDSKLKLKVSKAEFVHESWMVPLSAKTQDKISEIIESTEVKTVLNDLVIDRKMQFCTPEAGFEWCSMDPKSKKKVEKQLNADITDRVDIFALKSMVTELQDQGVLQMEKYLVSPPEGKRLYRLEFGRYCDDYDEYGNEYFREVRLSEIKIYRREDVLKPAD